jgi:hypothetical protein
LIRESRPSEHLKMIKSHSSLGHLRSRLIESFFHFLIRLQPFLYIYFRLRLVSITSRDPLISTVTTSWPPCCARFSFNFQTRCCCPLIVAASWSHCTCCRCIIICRRLVVDELFSIDYDDVKGIGILLLKNTEATSVIIRLGVVTTG